MSKIVLIYASMTGNTEEMADAVTEGLREAGEQPDVFEAMDAQADNLPSYDGIVLGAYTWGDGELPDEFLDFYEELDGLELTGKKAAVFGSCDSSYAQYGKAVDILCDKLRELGCDVVLDGLKIELCPTAEERETCRDFGRQFAQLVGG